MSNMYRCFAALAVVVFVLTCLAGVAVAQDQGSEPVWSVQEGSNYAYATLHNIQGYSLNGSGERITVHVGGNIVNTMATECPSSALPYNLSPARMSQVKVGSRSVINTDDPKVANEWMATGWRKWTAKITRIKKVGGEVKEHVSYTEIQGSPSSIIGATNDVGGELNTSLASAPTPHTPAKITIADGVIEFTSVLVGVHSWGVSSVQTVGFTLRDKVQYTYNDIVAANSGVVCVSISGLDVGDADPNASATCMSSRYGHCTADLANWKVDSRFHGSN